MHRLRKGNPRDATCREIVVQRGCDLEKRLLAQGFAIVGVISNPHGGRWPAALPHQGDAA